MLAQQRLQHLGRMEPEFSVSHHGGCHTAITPGESRRQAHQRTWTIDGGERRRAVNPEVQADRAAKNEEHAKGPFAAPKQDG